MLEDEWSSAVLGGGWIEAGHDVAGDVVGECKPITTVAIG